MQKMKKMLCLALALVMVFAMAACGGSDKPATDAAAPAADAAAPAADAAAPAADDTVYTLNFYHIFAGVGHEQKWIQKAIEEVEAQSDGHIKINCVPDGTMGGEDELIPQVFAGTLDMSLSGPSVWGTVGGIDEIGWSELPYVVTNYSEMNALGEILPELTNKQLEAKGIDLYCLGAMSQGIRCLLRDPGQDLFIGHTVLHLLIGPFQVHRCPDGRAFLHDVDPPVGFPLHLFNVLDADLRCWHLLLKILYDLFQELLIIHFHRLFSSNICNRFCFLADRIDCFTDDNQSDQNHRDHSAPPFPAYSV